MCLGLANGCRKPITKKRTYEELKQTHFPEKNSGAELTREDVIKALECCTAGNCESGNCPLFSPGDIDVCTTKLATLALEIIENDKGEINKLLYENQMLSRYETDLIKDFAKRLKNAFKGIGGLYCVSTIDAKIESLIKEMVGDES